MMSSSFRVFFAALLVALPSVSSFGQNATPAGQNAAPPAQANPLRAADDNAATAPSTSTNAGAAGEPADGANDADALELTPGPTAKELQQQLAALDQAGLSDDEKTKATENLQKALEWETAADQHLQKAEDFEQRREALYPVEPGDGGETPAEGEETPEQRRKRLGEIEFAKQRLDEAKLLEPKTQEELQVDFSLENLEQLTAEELAEKVKQLQDEVDAAEKAAAKYQADADKWRNEQSNRQTRLNQIADEVAEAKRQLATTVEELSQFQGNGDVTAPSYRARLTARRRAAEAHLYALDHEQAYYRESSELIKPKYDNAALRNSYHQKQLEALRAVVSSLRNQMAAGEREKAEQEAKIERPEAIAELANQNASLAQRAEEIGNKIDKITEAVTAAKERQANIETQFKETRDKVGAGELSEAMGVLLRNQQDQLPDLRSLKRRRALRAAERSEMRREFSEMYSRWTELANMEEQIAETVAQVPGATPKNKKDIADLLENERTLLDKLTDAYQDYINSLSNLDLAESQIQWTTEQFNNFIAERVLWIRSAETLHPRDVRPVLDGVAWSLDPRNWTAAGVALVSGSRRRPIEASLFVVAFAVLLCVQRSARRTLRELGEEAEKRTCVKMPPTVHALWLTAIIALPWSALLAFAGRTMDSPLNDSEFVRSLAVSLQLTAMCLLLLELLRHLCRKGGLADAHFGWPESCLLQIRARVRWLIVLGIPLVLWVVGLDEQKFEPMWNDSLGRVCFIALMIVSSVVLYGLLMREESPLRKLMLDGGGGWLTSLSKYWRPLVTFLPAALAILAASGFYYTAQHAAVRLWQTAVLLLGVLVLGGLTRRWLLVNRRRLARAQAVQRRAQLAAAAESEGATPPVEVVEETVDLAALSDQTEKLVRTVLAMVTAIGLYVVWDAILPALAFIDSPLPGLADMETPLTWGRLLLFAVILGVTYLAVRDIPALLEVVVLQKLPLDGGSRYALSTICRYVLAGLGIAAAYRSLGFTGQNIQWLIAAMGVGLGFGLQEIFANFVSGIILLFERPIRVGDIVTLGDTTGVVNRIRMRATTIIDWDRKEYIVPNKDLMTERLLNWTLTDLTNRVVVEVGVAYGSDTNAAIKLLLEAAAEHPLILDDPKPIATFEGFGDSSLNLVLRCYLPNLDNRLATIHELHTAIDRKFHQADIEIPFPQRDLHLRSAPEAVLYSHLHADGKSGGDGTNGVTAHAASGEDENAVHGLGAAGG